LAQSGHHDRDERCPLLGVKQTLGGGALMSAFDPKRKWGTRIEPRRTRYQFGALRISRRLL
jgi:hypothetical protein